MGFSRRDLKKCALVDVGYLQIAEEMALGVVSSGSCKAFELQLPDKTVDPKPQAT